jgi:hypothetical protein
MERKRIGRQTQNKTFLNRYLRDKMNELLGNQGDLRNA